VVLGFEFRALHCQAFFLIFKNFFVVIVKMMSKQFSPQDYPLVSGMNWDGLD
jgi:hypothetical protein